MLPIKRNGSKCTTAYTYETASDGGQTGRVKTVKNGSHSENYTYDTWGNVTKVTENSSQSGKIYAYDAQGQLIREYDPDKKVWLGYKYDVGGNMTEVRSYQAAEGGSPEGDGTAIKKFVYGTAWKDQLAAMTVEGTTRKFTYDANGNLLSDGKYTYSWTKGSLLAKVTGDGLEAAYTYDASGIRTSKTVNGVKTEYLTAGGSILAEKKNGKWQHYLYDGSGQLMAIRYKGADYYYIRDGLMCITGLVDANGGAVVNYRYDSWGKLISITGSMADTLGKDNPYRYKGYYYDDETGMYYLKSRYYQPEICRFIIARAMGQEFGVKDVAVAAVLGAVGGIAAFFSASGIGDLASLPLVDEGKIVAGNVLATGSIDLVVNTGYTGMSSAISTAASSSHKSTISSRNRNSKKNNYMRNMRPRKVFDKWIRKGGHIYHVWKYLYHGKLYTRWEKLR